MAVYTHLSDAEVARFLQNFGLPQLMRVRATDSGIENTNYFVDAADASGHHHALVLTLFERGDVQSLPYFIELTTYLGNQGLPVPSPYRDLHQQALHYLQGKACLLVPRFSGQHPARPTVLQCRAIGVVLAQMHQASAGFKLHRDNDRGAHWRQRVADRVTPRLPANQRTLLAQQVQDWQQQLPVLAQLPSGITHGDLFHDNALFEGDTLTGIIDFYNACTDIFIYDLAVVVNDWCSNANFEFDSARLQAVLAGYESLRPRTPAELACWPAVLRFAALRFWLSRLENWHFPGAGAQVKQKDPEPMRQLLLRRICT